MKTASRIVGTAAFRQGYSAQDSPVYGAERRGAPMMAFTRFDSKPVLERGIVSSPDLVAIADASLVGDPLVKPLQGLPVNGYVLVNATGPVDTHCAATVVHDFTSLALKHTGSTASLSVAFGAAAARLAGLQLHSTADAVLEELQELKLDAVRLEKNLRLAEVSFETVGNIVAGCSPRSGEGGRNIERGPTVRVVTPAYEGGWAGTASVAASPNTPLRKTGDWRVMRPEIDSERCTHCWICFVNCPDGAITLGSHDAPQIDYGVCKGCLICVEECPIEAIVAEREGVAT